MIRRTFVLGLATLGLGMADRASAADVDLRKVARVKEGLLHHLVQLTRWPPDAREEGEALVLAAYGNIDVTLWSLLSARARATDMRLVRVQPAGESESDRKRAVDELGRAHLVYTAREGRDAVLRRLWENPILLVGEGSSFAREVGSVAFVIRGGKVQLEVNVSRAREAGLEFSAQLLQHARIVG